jgi:signal transduction histidine kinase
MGIYAIFPRLFAGAMMIIVWGLTGSPLSGVVYILILTALSATRYRVKRYRWLGLAETAVCAVYSLFWLPALLGLWLPILGFVEDKWLEREKELLIKDYEDRAQRLRLESDRKSAEAELRGAARIAEITERARIAQDIHDHVGHEISGALLALQTALKLSSRRDERAGELLLQTVKRLESASENLRETVHNLKPSQTADLSSFTELCDGFEFCKVDFTASGDLSGVNRWELLTANLKEALTNIARHSDADKVTVKLNVNAGYIRLIISDNGKIKRKPQFGLGLTGMKERVRAADGSLSVNTDDGFKIICVIPK